MVESRALSLFHACRAYQEELVARLREMLAMREGLEIGTGQLGFLAQLDCGVTQASAIARELGVSRQAVHRQVRELEALGLLRLEVDRDRRNANLIAFTERGIALMALCRQCLAELDAELAARAGGADVLDGIARTLGAVSGR